MSTGKGQATVEMTLLLPLLCLLLFGTLDLARYAKTVTELNNAAHVGLMKAQNTYDASGTPIAMSTVVAAARNADAQATVVVVPSLATVPPDAIIRVEASTKFRPITPFVANLRGTSVITGSSTGKTLP
jgi:Flp pilus assembly protein TadG